MHSETRTPLDFEAIAGKLRQEGGERLWRSLDEVACTPEYEAFLHDEFPNDPGQEPETAAQSSKRGLNRRQVLKLMAASAALSGLTGCTKLPTRKIVRYAHAHDEMI